MKGGVLEVLLVNAEGLKHTSFLGNSGYYVVLQLGKETHTSKITSGNGKRTCWNEKFTFKLSLPDGRWNLTQLSLRILERHRLGQDDVFGESMIHLGGFLTEGHERGHLEQMPAPYNIVAEDGTYEGEVKVGLRFIAEGNGTQMERKEKPRTEKPRYSIYNTIFSLVQVPWLKLHFFPDVANPTETRKQKLPDMYVPSSYLIIDVSVLRAPRSARNVVNPDQDLLSIWVRRWSDKRTSSVGDSSKESDFLYIWMRRRRDLLSLGTQHATTGNGLVNVRVRVNPCSPYLVSNCQDAKDHAAVNLRFRRCLPEQSRSVFLSSDSDLANPKLK